MHWSGNHWPWLVALAMVMAGCGGSNSGPSSTADSGSSPAEDGPVPALASVTLQLNWFAEAEHGGYYAALVHGYYREAGLDVKILPGGPDTPVLQQVARGAVTFGVINADNILFARAEQVPAVALMAPLQMSPRCLLVHESSGIQDFSELRNVTIAMSASSAFSQFLRYKLPLEGVKIVAYSGNIAQFLLDKRYVQQGYVFSEPYIARKAGGDPRVLMVSDLGFNPYTSLLCAHDEMLSGNPGLAEKMVAASVRGWEKYVVSPEETNQYIHRVNPEIGLDILAYGAGTLKPLVIDRESQQHGIGTMSRERWQELADQLVASGQLKKEDEHVDDAFSTKFLPLDQHP